MKGLWGEGPFSFEGEHYQVAEVDAVPKPYSPIPIMIGGGGPKILALAAEEADIVGINPKIVGRKINPESMATTAADAMDEKVDAVRAAAGDRFDELELQVQIFKTVVTDQPAGGRRAARVRRSGCRPTSCSTRRSSRSARSSRSPRTSRRCGSAGGSATSCSRPTGPPDGTRRRQARRHLSEIGLKKSRWLARQGGVAQQGLVRSGTQDPGASGTRQRRPAEAFLIEWTGWAIWR